jgi:hypothetical protein
MFVFTHRERSYCQSLIDSVKVSTCAYFHRREPLFNLQRTPDVYKTVLTSSRTCYRVLSKYLQTLQNYKPCEHAKDRFNVYLHDWTNTSATPEALRRDTCTRNVLQLPVTYLKQKSNKEINSTLQLTSYFITCVLTILLRVLYYGCFNFMCLVICVCVFL